MRKSWLPSFMSNSPSAAPQQAADDDDWSDVASVDESLGGSKGSNRLSDGGIDAETKARTSSNIPSIFSTALPPCGMHPQCAFENVNNRLRKLWLRQSHNNPAINMSTVDICKLVHDELEAEDKEFPQGTLTLAKSRRPWRLESVFKYELLWSKWFIREAEIQERLSGMDSGEREIQNLMDRMYPMPKELCFVKNRANEKGIHALWLAWARGKRGWLPLDESLDLPLTMENVSLGGTVREPWADMDHSCHGSENSQILEPALATDAREMWEAHCQTS